MSLQGKLIDSHGNINKQDEYPLSTVSPVHKEPSHHDEVNTILSLFSRRLENALEGITCPTAERCVQTTKEKEVPASVIPGACVLLAGPCGSGKTHLVTNELLPRIKEDIKSRYRKSCVREVSYNTDSDLKLSTCISIQERHIFGTDPMSYVYKNDSTALSYYLFDQDPYDEATIVSSDNLKGARELKLESSTMNTKRQHNLIINLVVWDHFELPFGMSQIVMNDNYTTGSLDELRLGIGNKGSKHSGVNSGSMSLEDASKRPTVSSDGEASGCFAVSPELLTHFIVLSKRSVKGTSLGHYRKMLNKESDNKEQSRQSTVKVLTFLICVATSPSLEAFDPILVGTPSTSSKCTDTNTRQYKPFKGGKYKGGIFDMVHLLPTPTEEGRRRLLISRGLPEGIARQIGANTGGYSCEYLANLADYISIEAIGNCTGKREVPKENCLEAQEDLTIRDDDSFTTPMPLDMLLKSFDELNTEATTTACHPGQLSAGLMSSIRSKIGYVDVQQTLWSSIAGLEDAKGQLIKLATPIKKAAMYKKHGLSPAIGAVLYGPPGTGKTMLARAMATEAAASFMYLDLSELVSSEIGESERILGELFSIAKERSPCVIFIDEIQAAFGQRYCSKRGGNNAVHDARLVTSLVSLLDSARENFFEYPICFLGATNLIDLMDPTLLRDGRLDLHIYVGPPCDNAREYLIRSYINSNWSAWMPSDSADHVNDSKVEESMYYTVANSFIEHSKGLTGAEIKNAMNQFALSLLLGESDDIQTDTSRALDKDVIQRNIVKCCSTARGTASTAYMSE